MKIWVDPPSGWQYGFPKVYDEEVDGPMLEWLKKEGYPEEPTYIRSWQYEEPKEKE